MSFDLPVRLLAPHPGTNQDTLTVTRGPIVYVAESVDNADLEGQCTHFEGVGISASAKFHGHPIEIEGVPVISLSTGEDDVLALAQLSSQSAYRRVTNKSPARSWKRLYSKLTFVPWFARANRGGAGHIRVAMMRAEENTVYTNGVA